MKDDEDETMDPDPAEVVRVEEGETVLEALGLVPDKDEESR